MLLFKLYSYFESQKSENHVEYFQFPSQIPLHGNEANGELATIETFSSTPRTLVTMSSLLRAVDSH